MAMKDLLEKVGLGHIGAAGKASENYLKKQKGLDVPGKPIAAKADPAVAAMAKKKAEAKKSKEAAALRKAEGELNQEYKGMSKLEQMIAADKAKQAKKNKG